MPGSAARQRGRRRSGDEDARAQRATAQLGVGLAQRTQIRLCTVAGEARFVELHALAALLRQTLEQVRVDRQQVVEPIDRREALRRPGRGLAQQQQRGRTENNRAQFDAFGLGTTMLVEQPPAFSANTVSGAISGWR